MPEAEEARDHYLKELQDFYQHLVDRPVHLLHILDGIANTRYNLEPKVNDVVVEIRESDILLQKYNDYSEHADELFKKLEKLKRICQINCDNEDIDPSKDILS